MKLYFAETGSREFTQIVEGRTDLVVSDLALTEITTALARRVREGRVRPHDARRMQRTVIASVDTMPWQRAELTRDVHRRAENLLLALTDTPLRGADALHLALAFSAHAASIATFDARLGVAARAVGLTVYPA